MHDQRTWTRKKCCFLKIRHYTYVIGIGCQSPKRWRKGILCAHQNYVERAWKLMKYLFRVWNTVTSCLGCVFHYCLLVYFVYSNPATYLFRVLFFDRAWYPVVSGECSPSPGNSDSCLEVHGVSVWFPITWTIAIRCLAKEHHAAMKHFTIFVWPVEWERVCDTSLWQVTNYC